MKKVTFWDSFTSPYQMGPQKHRLYLLNLLKEKKIKSILDVGCGTGPIYELIKNEETLDVDLTKNPVEQVKHKTYNFKYKGTDYAEGMITLCREQFPEGNFEVEDARKLNESDNSWECVLLLHSLDHLDDYKAAISEAARVTSKYVCIVLWRGFIGAGTHLNDRNMMNKNPGEEPWHDTHLQEYSKEALEKEFMNNNLQIEEAVEGAALNSDTSHYNFLYLLKKI